MLKIDYKVIEFLESVGLSDTERKLYLSGLQFPEADVNRLVQETGINRTTAYHALGTLKQKGLTSEVKVQGRLVYTMHDPKRLDKYLDRKSAAIQKQKQELIQLENLFPMAQPQDTDDMSVEKFEEIEGVKDAVEKALYCRSREWKIIAPKDNFFAQVEKEYASYFLKTREERGIRAKTLWERNSSEPANLSLRDFMMRRPRYLQPEFSGKFKSVIILFDDKALFITSAEQHSALLLQSDEIIQTLNVLFDGLWATSQSLKKEVK